MVLLQLGLGGIVRKDSAPNRAENVLLQLPTARLGKLVKPRVTYPKDMLRDLVFT